MQSALLVCSQLEQIEVPAASLLVRAAPKGIEVEDHDTGAGASAVGVSGASPAVPAGPPAG
ncbi:hypothetical protein EOA75_33180, partial [Mesorhizobium sp. M1A.F.Ca.IN.022.07.1.1]